MNPGDRNSRCTVYRPTEGANNRGRVTQTYTATTITEWIRIRRDRGALRDLGPGEQPAGVAVGDARWNARIEERDVLDVVGGAERGTKWRVESVFHPGKEKMVLSLVPFAGTLPS